MFKKLLFIQIIIYSIAFGQTVWWVDLKNGSDSNDGKSEAGAFKTVQQALESNNAWESGDTIKVKPSLDSDGKLSYYDFGGKEINLNTSKDFVLIATSKDPDSTIFDAESKNRHFYFDDGQTSATSIEGITFKNGYIENRWPGGGSIALMGKTNIRFINCIWDSNKAYDNTSGGAVYISDNSTPSFSGCTFKNNSAVDDDSGTNGGAIHMQNVQKAYLNSKITIENTQFINNFVRSKHSSYGGAIYAYRDTDIINSTFIENGVISGYGDGVNNWHESLGGAILNNAHAWEGGTVYGGTINVINCTFDRNYVDSRTDNGNVIAADIFYGWDHGGANIKTYVFNTIIRGSSAIRGGSEYTGDEERKIFGAYSNNAKIFVNHSNIENGSTQSWADDEVYDINPAFKDTANNDYSLSDNSPMIGVGVGTWSDEDKSAPTKDILGNTRPTTNYNPDVDPVVYGPDMGAYENSLSSSSAPLPVSGLVGTKASSGANLSWNALKVSLGSSSNASNIEYQIYQDGTGVGTTSDTSYSVTGLQNGTAYSFSVTAKNTSTNIESASSNAVIVTAEYSGPKWYVASSGGSSSTVDNSDLGSVNTPLNHLSSAFDLIATKGDTIIMMEGTHSGSNNRGINLNGNKSFVLMGDPNSTPDKVIIDAGGRDKHFTFDNNEDTTTQIIGLTLYNGEHTNGWGGGSIYINNGAVKLKNVIFKENHSTSNDWYSAGAVFAYNFGATTIENCTFDGNYILHDDGSGMGGAIAILGQDNDNDTIRVINSTFKNNYVKTKYEGQGGAMVVWHSQAVIENNLFYNNYVHAGLDANSNQNALGGGVYIYNPNYWDHNAQTSRSLTVSFTNNTVANNYLYSEETNSWMEGPGMRINGGDVGLIVSFNNIIWGNYIIDRTTQRQVYIDIWNDKLKYYDDYNIIQNVQDSDNANRHGDYTVSIDPAFVDSANGDFSLSDKSLLIGYGAKSFEGFDAPSTDITGALRPNPVGSNPDVGAYENALANSPYPKQVKNVTAVGGSGQVTLTWDLNDDTDNIAKYNVYMHTAAFDISADYLQGNTTSNTFTTIGLDNGTRYYFRVTAVNEDELEGTPSSSIDLTPAYSGPVWWVATTGDDGNEGSNGSPFASLSEAIERAAKGDTIVLKEGTYTGSKNRGISISNGDPEIVIKSEKGPENTIIDAGFSNQHIFEFTTSDNESDQLDSSFQVIGIQFTRASPALYFRSDNGWDQSQRNHLQPKFINNIFYNNRNIQNHAVGGAVFIDDSSPIFEDCVFDSNFVHGQGGAIGIQSDHGSSSRTHIRSSTFRANTAYFPAERPTDQNGNEQWWQPMGSAVSVWGNATVTIIDCLIENNHSLSDLEEGMGVHGAIYMNWEAPHDADEEWMPIIARNVISNNRITSYADARGGGIYSQRPMKVINNLVSNNVLRTTSTGGSVIEGAGIWIDNRSMWNHDTQTNFGLNAYFINNTITNNEQYFSDGLLHGGGAGIYFENQTEDSETIFFNNIVWGNQAWTRPNFGNSDHHGDFYKRMRVEHNNIQNFSETVVYNALSKNFDIDPAFIDSANGNFLLSDASQLIGAGDTEFEGYSAPTVDLLGNTRPSPAGSKPDIGAYENSLSESPYPSQVKNLTASVSSGAVDLSWDLNEETDIEEYVIYMSQTSGFVPSDLDIVGTTTDGYYSVTGLTNRQTYYFKVAAVDLDGYQSVFSKEVEATPAYQGPTWYISQDGNDETGDGTKENPFQSIVWPFHNVISEQNNDGFFSDGDTIRLLPGNYGIYEGNNQRGIEIMQGAIKLPDGGNYNTSLSNFTIIGDSGDPADVFISANGTNRHFTLYRTKAVFKNVIFAYGFTSDQGAGSIEAVESEIEFSNVIFTDNRTNAGGGAIALVGTQANFSNVLFYRNSFDIEPDWGGLGAGVLTAWNWDNIGSTVTFDQCRFIENGVNDNNGYGASGGVFNIDDPNLKLVVTNSEFRENYLNSPNYNFGTILRIQPFSFDNWNSAHIPEFHGCTFIGNDIPADVNPRGLLFDIGTGIQVTNSLLVQNRSKQPAHLISIDANQDSQGQNTWVELRNNTIVDNLGIDDIYRISDFANVDLENNIIWNNPNVQNGLGNWQNGQHYFRHNILQNQFKDLEGRDGFGHENNLYTDPKLKNPSNGNYQLSGSSPAIDAGYDNGLLTDIRGYYRVGTPDIGAYEFGASKYLLAIDDDIEGEHDTTFVDLNQEITFTITTNDIDGNLVSSNEDMTWSVFPNQKYVSYVSGDQSTEGGDASATFRVTNQSRGKGFRFRIQAGVGEAFLRSKMYVIEELVTGAPPPVAELTISPSTWTPDPNFTMDWKTPYWSEQRDLIGAVVEITDGYNEYNEFLEFPSGDTLNSYSFTAPEPGEFEAFLWLIDELGNEDKDSSSSVRAYYDDISPEKFYIYNPYSYRSGVDIFYSSAKPRFEWDDMGDYPSGIKEWEVHTLQRGQYGTYTRSDVRFEDPGNPNMGYINGETALQDGYYDWFVVAIDSAGNSVHSDTGYFGVDLSPPNIVHSNPLTIIDENTTSPAINANFSDAASGVKIGQLHYRRAGSGGGFVTVDLLSGPVNIPGSDIKADGIEYYIDSEDNIGNYGKWPKDKAFQSVKVRTEGSVSTAGNLSLNGGTDSTNYIFFSIPFDVGNGIGAFKSMMDPENKGPDEFKYRLYAYNNGWQENPSSLTMGNGYFFIFDPDKYTDVLPIQFDFGQGVSTATDPPYKVNVTPGQWKFFGLPYNFNVSLSNIYTETGASLNDAGSIYTWSSSWKGAGSTLQPWKGYIFKSGGDTELYIDARGDVFGKLAKSFDPENIPFDVNEWIIDIVATTGNTRDELNAVGVRHIAEDGYDRLDEFEPPTVPGNITLRIDNRDREIAPDIYAKDIRKPNDTGHYWDLQVYTPTNGQRTYITFEGLGYVPEEYDVFLINKTTKQAKNLEWDSQYRFANTGSESYLKQELRLVVGTKKFVEDNNAGVSLYPDAFTLSQNYPNPFNPQTSIMISLEEDANVDLVIYNLLGEEITRLAANEFRPAGYYNFIWNGRNAIGDKVATGVYFYHAMIRNDQGKVVLNKTRKMIFLK